MFTVDEVLDKHYPNLRKHPAIKRPIKFLLKRLMHESDALEFGKNYGHLSGLDFVEQVLEYFDISVSTRDREVERIPTHGKCVIIANHPIGSLDALALIKTVMEVRGDLKVVANQMLMALTPLHDLLLPVNNMDGNTKKENLKAIQHHLQNDGILLIFPAGEVSRLRPHGVRDTQWHAGFLKFARAAKAPILPVYIDAKNSPTFYSTSMIYKPLATSLLIEEMFKHKKNTIGLRIGEQIPYLSYINMGDSIREQVNLFKRQVYRIGSDKPPIFDTQKAIALPEDRRALLKEIESLCTLLGSTSDGKKIYLYRHTQSSSIMREIGRLREFAFRAVGEGTNRRRDVDAFDRHYFHLLLWDERQLEIAGAYRFGDAKVLSHPHHESGLYSATLFTYTDKMAPYFENGLELGRSFVQPQYWGKRNLDYLWQGIGAFVARYPQYRYLFGPVSIPGGFPKAAIDLIVNFYSTYFKATDTLAIAKIPPLNAFDESLQFSGENYALEFTKLKDMLKHMDVRIPTLVKQYSELCQPGGCQFIAFNRDPDFNDCIDGLVMVDMHKLTEKKRQRYLLATSLMD